MTVVILSTSDNDHAQAIGAGVMARREQVLRIDTNTVVSQESLLGFETPAKKDILFAGESVDISGISGVFFHHPRTDIPDSKGADSLDRRLFAASWNNAFDWMERQLSHATWVNSPSRSRRSTSVAHQLEIARSAGFRVPATLFTNDLRSLEEFAGRYPQMVIKSGPIPGVLPQQHRILTKMVDLNSIERGVLASAPCLFQEYVEKAFELRVHVMGDLVLTCKIESQSNPTTSIDWRNYAISVTPHSAFDLAREVADRCRTILGALELAAGIMDVIVTPDGDHVFLECNAQGSWLWIEQLTGLPITERIVDLLLGKKS